MSPRRTVAKILTSVLLFLGVVSITAAPAPGTEVTPKAAAGQRGGGIPWSDLGARARAVYHGNGLAVSATEAGARLRCTFQKLEGEVSCAGLRLVSTEKCGSGDHFQVTASTVGRAGDAGRAIGPGRVLASTGSVEVTGQRARFARPGLVEEYSVSVDGVQQDFVIAERPAGRGDLRVGLAVSGARAEKSAQGARLTLERSGRAMAYWRLHAVDAKGQELAARLMVLSADRLEVRVEDSSAAYPVRIDPTFSAFEWISMSPGILGPNNDVLCEAVDGSGRLYIGGGFSFVGRVPASKIAIWDGTAWSTLGTGVDSTVNALAVSGTTLYVGGDFKTAGGVRASRIARWDGSAWSALGTGVDSTVNALAVSGTSLYVGGYFTTAGGVATNGIARWDGSTWSALGTGMNGGVSTLGVSGTNLYAGGSFTTSGGVTTNHIAKWDGSVWSTLNSGVNNSVLALAVSDTSLYVGGAFNSAGIVAAKGIARWDGSAWSALGTGVNGTVRALAISGTNLYAGGNFSTAGGSAARAIAKWDGSAWSSLSTGISDNVFALAVIGTNLYVGGDFGSWTGMPSNFIVRWDGSTWSVLGTEMNSYVRALALSGTDLYVGGPFTRVNGVTASRVAKWNGSTWSALGTGVDSTVTALAVSGTNLYAGGYFKRAGGVTASYIARWDGSAWSALGTGVDSTVYALAVSGTSLFAGGYFKTAGGVTAVGIARWDGSAWSALGTGMNGSAVEALAVSGTNLYAGGGFATSGGVTTNRIAKWDGNTWSALGTGMNDFVTSLAVSGTSLYAGGGFTTAGGAAANYIARWDGNAWSALGAGTNNQVFSLAVSGTNLYVGGIFTTAGGGAANALAKWDGSAWSALGGGMTGDPGGGGSWVNALAPDLTGGGFYVGGSFLWAGTTLSPFIARGVPEVLSGFSPPFGPYGSSVAISGSGLAAASAVRFNGTAATFAVNSDLSITATVPVGATVGTIAVDVPGATLTTPGFFWPPGWPACGVPVDQATADQVNPKSVPDGRGGMIVAWQAWNGFDYDIYAQRMNSIGQPLWPTSGVVLCQTTGDQMSPVLAPDGAGGAIVTWQDRRIGNFDIYAQRIGADGIVRWVPNGIPVCDAGGDQTFPAILSDNAGGAIIAWDDTRGGLPQVFAQRVDSTGVGKWGFNGEPMSTQFGPQVSPALTSDGAGGAIVTWQDGSVDPAYDIYAQRVTAAGISGSGISGQNWLDSGVPLCQALGSQQLPVIVSDGSGGAIVAWEDARLGGPNDIYARRVNSGGVPLWTTDGVLLCGAVGDQTSPVITTDGAGGAIVAWQDGRTLPGLDIYAQRVDSTGATGLSIHGGSWPALGVPLCTATNNQGIPTIVSDGAGGATVTWMDLRTGLDYDIYAQGVSGTGAVRWALNGVALCTGQGNQTRQFAVPDSTGGEIVCWMDDRGGSTHVIYADRLSLNGTIPTGVAQVPRAATGLSLGPIYPNPFNPIVSIQFGLVRDGRAQVQIFDALGRRVRTLFDEQGQPGVRTIRWDGTDEMGRGVASGIYYCRLSAAGGTLTRKLALVR